MSQELFQQAVRCHQAGDLAGAERRYHAVLAQVPQHAEAMANLGQMQESRGDLAGALGWYEAALEVTAGRWHIHYNRAQVLRAMGRNAEAVEAYRRALALAPEEEIAALGLGVALLALGQSERALGVFTEARRHPPRNPMIRAAIVCNQGTLLRDQNRLDEARACYEEALRLNPDVGMVWSNLGFIHFLTGQIDETLQCIQRALALDPDNPILLSNALYWQLFHPAIETEKQRATLALWAEQYADGLARAIPPHGNDRAPERRLRVGLVSPNFGDHVVAFNLMPMFQQMDHAAFEVFCYSDIPHSDYMTEAVRRHADSFRQVGGMSHEALAEVIRGDKIDILVDLALHLGGNRLLLFARKPAPVQVTFAGYPGSTGLKAMDYRLTDPYLDPPEHEGRYVEKAVRLPATFWCYQCYEIKEAEWPQVGPLPAERNGHITFGCLNNFGKVNLQQLALWARVLGGVEGSRLALLTAEGRHRQRTVETLGKMGIAPERVIFYTMRRREEYLELYQQIDIGLDTLPYNGHTTSLDSFFMGVPVVTLVGRTVVGRAGLSQAMNLGLGELVGRTEEEYVAIAQGLAGDRGRLARMRAGLRERMRRSPLMDAAGFTRGIEGAFRQMWRTWCG